VFRVIGVLLTFEGLFKNIPLVESSEVKKTGLPSLLMALTVPFLLIPSTVTVVASPTGSYTTTLSPAFREETSFSVDSSFASFEAFIFSPSPLTISKNDFLPFFSTLAFSFASVLVSSFNRSCSEASKPIASFFKRSCSISNVSSP
jgi:hypothetical protein